MISQISEQVYNENQSWYFERVVEVKAKGGKKHVLQIDIRRNAYDNQSYAKVKRWNGEEWKQVIHQPISRCECKGISYVQGGIRVSHFENDAKRLMEEAVQIVTA